MESNTQLTLVIPYYNEKHRFGAVLDSLIQDWPGDLAPFELIVVNDGSRSEDRLFLEKTIQARITPFKIRVMHLEKNSGKGAALREGFSAARTTYVGFMDADGSTEILSVYKVYEKLLQAPGLSACIGSRIMMLGMRIYRKNLRHYIGRIFATYVSVLFSVNVYDSQCGCKFFRREAIVPLLNVPNDLRWTWDTQILLLLLKTHHNVIEFPVNWSEQGGSKLNFVSDPLRMFYFLLRFYLRHPWGLVKVSTENKKDVQI